MNETSTVTTARNNTADQFSRKNNPETSNYGHNRWHNLIATNIAIAIGSRTSGGKTEIYVNGMAVALGAKTTSYPSVSVVNGEPQFTTDASDVLQNPTVVVEIISNNTDAAGRAQKLESYLAIPSIKECLLVRVDEMRIEHYARQNAKQWLYRIYDGRDDVVGLDSLNCKMSVAEFYAQIKIKQAEMSSKAVH